MGREAATYLLALSPPAAEAAARSFDAAGIERVHADDERLDYCVRDPDRYWIDLRIHLASPQRIEIRIALTNDTWVIRAPLERALAPLLDGVALCVGHSGSPVLGERIAVIGADGWSLALEDDYGRRRDEFVARVGNYNAPLSAEHVYMYLHQTRWNEDNDAELEWHREREISKMEEMWEQGDEPPGEL
jgi:hypothetical protein